MIRDSPSEGVLFLGINPAQQAVRPSRQRSPSRCHERSSAVVVTVSVDGAVDCVISRGSNPGPRVRSDDYGVDASASAASPAAASAAALMVAVRCSGNFCFRAAFAFGGFFLRSFVLFGSRCCHGT